MLATMHHLSGRRRRLTFQSHTQVREQTRQCEQTILEITKSLQRYGSCEVESLWTDLAVYDPDTAAHSRRVSINSARLSQRAGWSSFKVECLAQAALIHDIGKVGVPIGVLRSVEKLTRTEYALIQRHTTWGAVICSQSNSPVWEMAADVAFQHHERWDGQGYPANSAGRNVSLPARIVAIADAYDAMTNDRNYSPGVGRTTAVERLQNGRRTQFDAALVDLFVELLEDGQLTTASDERRDLGPVSATAPTASLPVADQREPIPAENAGQTWQCWRA